MAKKNEKSYKDIINDKKREAGHLMTEDQVVKCNAAIHTAAVASGAAGFIPVPVADAVPISAAQITMVIALGKIFDQKLTESAAKGAIGAAAATFVGRNLVKLVPVAGWVASAAVAAGVTEAIGWTIAVDFAKSDRKEWERKKAIMDAAETKIKNEFYEKNAAKDDDVEDLLSL